ncbi:MAG: helix-turn-helix domain-containing protein [Parasporobacterium sp.]|nr:helix-turn-helix domain-containing protein [Parasporobacterium sp.]
MISNQLLQKTIDEIKAIAGVDLAVLDMDGNAAVRTFREDIIDYTAAVNFAMSMDDQRSVPGYELFKIKDESEDAYILVIRGAGGNEKLIGRMAKYQIETLLEAYKERFDKENFYKSLLMDNMLLIDIFSRSRKLHIELEEFRSVYVVELKHKNQDDAIGTIRSTLADHPADFALALDKKNIIIIKSVSGPEAYDELEATAEKMQLALSRDIGDDALIAYGSIVPELQEVSKSYKEAKMAVDVGKIFFSEKNIISYGKLGIGRLIYQLPMPLCKLFIREILENISPDDFDGETLATINKFFENSLNVSETSRQLYIHRNTLVYRLDKIQKTTGLDLRIFEDAITFKIAMMVFKYMQYVEGLEYK